MVAKIMGLGLAVALVMCFGCGKKKDDGAMDPAKQQQMLREQQTKLQPAKEAVGEAVEEAKEAAQEVTETVEGEVQEATNAFDTLVADAKKLIDGKKYQDALTKLQAGLQIPNLTAEQKSSLQKLIEQAKTSLAGGTVDDAKKAAGDLLKGLGTEK